MAVSLRRLGAGGDRRGFTRPHPRPGGGIEGHMRDLLWVLAFLGAWYAVQRWLLPRFGVPT